MLLLCFLCVFICLFLNDISLATKHSDVKDLFPKYFHATDNYWNFFPIKLYIPHANFYSNKCIILQYLWLLYFYRNYRNQKLSPDEQYRAEIGSIVEEVCSPTAKVKVPLRNNKNEELTLEVTFLENNKARMKIASPNHQRYELVDVLESEPKTIE